MADESGLRDLLTVEEAAEVLRIGPPPPSSWRNGGGRAAAKNGFPSSPSARSCGCPERGSKPWLAGRSMEDPVIDQRAEARVEEPTPFAAHPAAHRRGPARQPAQPGLFV